LGREFALGICESFLSAEVTDLLLHIWLAHWRSKFERLWMERLMTYQHRLDGVLCNLPVGKVVCVGRNYAAHAKELNNPVPTEPLLFMKPATAIVPMAGGFSIPVDRGVCHFETEMSLLIGKRLSGASEADSLAAVVGVGLGFDLTLRSLQDELKAKGQPWDKAKGFDGSCPLSDFVSPGDLDWTQAQLQMQRNGELQQQGNSADMITPVAQLLRYISQFFTLMPGDVVLTGTPAGVGPLTSGDELEAQLDDCVSVKTHVL